MIIARTTLVWKKEQVLLTWRGILLVVVPLVLVVIAYLGLEASITFGHDEPPRQILLDTDVDTDDVFALFYLLKQNRKDFNLKAITINANAWSDAGHAINHVYDILFMMGRDDIPVGVGGEGGILPNGTILPNVGGYLPIIDQGTSIAGGCRYRQAIPPGLRRFINSNYGLRKGFLPQGDRQYNPIQQPTAQKVMTDAISAGPITVFLTGAHTNFAIFLMNNPHLKKNVEHIYVMGGAIRSNCLTNANSSTPETCSPIGNLYPPDINPYAEFNIFSDPLASYMVLHSGFPVTLIPLDATKTIPVSRNFFSAFEKRQDTYEAQYCFQSLKKIRDTWNNDEFHQDYCMWDSFMVGVALSIMKNSQSRDGENEFSDMEYMNITVVTANEPYGIVDGSNPLTDGRAIPGLILHKNMLHDGHVQMGMQDPFCLKNGRGGCQDGYTKEVNDSEAVRTLVATRAKSSHRIGNSLEREYYGSFLDVINQPEQSGQFSFITQFPYFQEVTYRPNFTGKAIGKTVVFDMDMSVGDFLALLYLLKLPPELINVKAILVSSTGWSTSATVDVLYDMLHMMGRDDILVGLGDVFAVGQAYPTYPAIGDCKYAKAIPHGSGGFLDSDTLYGLARQLPRSPRRYTAETSAIFGASRDNDHPELGQKSALDVWRSTAKSLGTESSITILANAPLTNLAQIIQSENTSVIKEIYIVGGQIGNSNERGNLFTIPSNEYAEFSMFLDPLAAKMVLNSDLNITFIPLNMQRKVSSFSKMLKSFENKIHTAEATFAQNLLSRLWKLQKEHHRYQHMDNFLGEILGAVTLAGNPYLNQTFTLKPLKILADGDESKLGQLVIDNEGGKLVKVLENVNSDTYYHHFAELLSADNSRSAVIGSFQEQKKQWSTKPNIPT